MHHARPAQLNPTRALANTTPCTTAFEATEIKLGARFGKWEVRGPKAGDSLWTKHAAQKLRYSTLQMCHGDSPVDAQSLNLKEHRIVSRVRRVTTKNPARRDHANWRTTSLHGVYLHCRGLRTQCKSVRRVERVLRCARGVVLRNVQGIEIVEVGLNLPIVLDRVAKSDEDVLDSLTQEGDWMKMPATRPAAGECYVNTLTFSLRSFYVALEPLLSMV